MSDSELKNAEGAASPVEDVEKDEEDYKAPEKKELKDILTQDKEDDALEKYKKQLLGEAASGEEIVAFPDDKRQVIITKMALIVDGQPDRTIDLTLPVEEIKKKKFVLKEGVKFAIRIEFYVQREIVSGLKYVQKTSRMSVTVDKLTHMVGSYRPQTTPHVFTTPYEDAPSGMTGRGKYSVHSLFTDDDKVEHMKWEWSIDVKKDWEDQ